MREPIEFMLFFNYLKKIEDESPERFLAKMRKF